MGLLSAIFRNFLGKPGASDFRDSAEHFVLVMREHGVALTFNKEELRFADALVTRLAAHNEFRDAVGSWLGEIFVRAFGGEWVPGHALGPAVRVKTAEKGVRHLFPLGWVYRRADGGAGECIAKKCQKELGYPEDSERLGAFDDAGGRIWPTGEKNTPGIVN
jgi:hypothetical protein